MSHTSKLVTILDTIDSLKDSLDIKIIHDYLNSKIKNNCDHIYHGNGWSQGAMDYSGCSICKRKTSTIRKEQSKMVQILDKVNSIRGVNNE